MARFNFHNFKAVFDQKIIADLRKNHKKRNEQRTATLLTLFLETPVIIQINIIHKYVKISLDSDPLNRWNVYLINLVGTKF